MTLGVGYSYFQDIESIRRGFPTFANHVDYVFAIDGKYAGNPAPNDFSVDGSTEFIKQWKNVIHRQFLGHEFEKRQQYCNLCKEFGCDYLLIIDTDEYVVEADWDLFKSNIEAQISTNPHSSFFGVPFIVDGSGGISYFPRLWFKPYLIEYYKTHCIFKDGRTGMLVTSGSAAKHSPVIEGITLTMDDSLRKPENIKNTYEYQLKMIEMEKPTRDKLW